MGGHTSRAVRLLISEAAYNVEADLKGNHLMSWFAFIASK